MTIPTPAALCYNPTLDTVSFPSSYSTYWRWFSGLRALRLSPTGQSVYTVPASSTPWTSGVHTISFVVNGLDPNWVTTGSQAVRIGLTTSGVFMNYNNWLETNTYSFSMTNFGTF